MWPIIFTKQPLPAWHKFLIDEFHAHLANADKARKDGDIAKLLDELQQARDALTDLQKLIDELYETWGKVD